MAQIKIYGRVTALQEKREAISIGIHQAVMEALAYPPEKRFHRFILLNDEDFLHPSDRSEQYLIIEISMFEGRSVEAKKRLINLIYRNLKAQAEIDAQDVEITIFETPRTNWGIRGKPGDELALNYKVDV